MFVKTIIMAALFAAVSQVTGAESLGDLVDLKIGIKNANEEILKRSAYPQKELDGLKSQLSSLKFQRQELQNLLNGGGELLLSEAGVSSPEDDSYFFPKFFTFLGGVALGIGGLGVLGPDTSGFALKCMVFGGAFFIPGGIWWLALSATPTVKAKRILGERTTVLDDQIMVKEKEVSDCDGKMKSTSGIRESEVEDWKKTLSNLEAKFSASLDPTCTEVFRTGFKLGGHVLGDTLQMLLYLFPEISPVITTSIQSNITKIQLGAIKVAEKLRNDGIKFEPYLIDALYRTYEGDLLFDPIIKSLESIGSSAGLSAVKTAMKKVQTKKIIELIVAKDWEKLMPDLKYYIANFSPMPDNLRSYLRNIPYPNLTFSIAEEIYQSDCTIENLIYSNNSCNQKVIEFTATFFQYLPMEGFLLSLGSQVIYCRVENLQQLRSIKEAVVTNAPITVLGLSVGTKSYVTTEGYTNLVPSLKVIATRRAY